MKDQKLIIKKLGVEAKKAANELANINQEKKKFSFK